MKQIGKLKILENSKIANDVYKIVLQGEQVTLNKRPGQFVNVKIDSFYLKRPISINDINKDKMTLVYKVLGNGTKELSTYMPGREIEVLVNLGNGFETSMLSKGSKALLVGGGVGVPPMLWLTKELVKKGVQVDMVIGARAKEDVILADEFKAAGANVHVATMDGSAGTKGTVLDVIEQNKLTFDQYFACGPTAMLKALGKKFETKGQLSFEERMACGFGGCMGCVCKNKFEPYKRVCVDGPVFTVEEVVWND